MDYLGHLRKAVEKRRDLFALKGCTAFRLVNGEGDGLDGLTVDIYGEYLLAQCFSGSPGADAARPTEALARLADFLPLTVLGVLLKDRGRRHPGAKDIASFSESVLLYGEMPPEDYIVEQNGVRVAVDLVKGQNTGLFLDMREVRGRLAGLYGGVDSLLNLFCYTAVFSVHAILNGARSAVNVDLSKAVLGRARANYSINGIEPDDRDFIREDAQKWVKRAEKKGGRFSMVIFDPPTFARNKKKSFSARKDYAAFCALLSGLAGGGYVLTSVNAAGVTENDYRSFHPASWELEFLSHESADFPFRRRPYLKAGLWRVK